MFVIAFFMTFSAGLAVMSINWPYNEKPNPTEKSRFSWFSVGPVIPAWFLCCGRFFFFKKNSNMAIKYRWGVRTHPSQLTTSPVAVATFESRIKQEREKDEGVNEKWGIIWFKFFYKCIEEGVSGDIFHFLFKYNSICIQIG